MVNDELMALCTLQQSVITEQQQLLHDNENLIKSQMQHIERLSELSRKLFEKYSEAVDDIQLSQTQLKALKILQLAVLLNKN